jgi:DNA repair ATPase RecN
MSQQGATAKEERRPGKKPFLGTDIRASLEADAQVWRDMQQTLMMSLEPWLKIQADLARHVEIAVQMAQMASQSEQYLNASEKKEELHSAISRWENIARSIKLPEIPPATPAINALRKADVNVEELVTVIQKQKDQLQLKEDEISRLKKLIAEIREKKREYIG